MLSGHKLKLDLLTPWSLPCIVPTSHGHSAMFTSETCSAFAVKWVVCLERLFNTCSSIFTWLRITPNFCRYKSIKVSAKTEYFRFAKIMQISTTVCCNILWLPKVEVKRHYRGQIKVSVFLKKHFMLRV